MLNGMYELINMDSNYVDSFAGGYCIRPLGDACEIFLTADGDVYIPVIYRHDYA